jgi:hypothetical protein
MSSEERDGPSLTVLLEGKSAVVYGAGGDRASAATAMVMNVTCGAVVD